MIDEKDQISQIYCIHVYTIIVNQTCCVTSRLAFTLFRRVWYFDIHMCYYYPCRAPCFTLILWHRITTYNVEIWFHNFVSFYYLFLYWIWIQFKKIVSRLCIIKYFDGIFLLLKLKEKYIPHKFTYIIYLSLPMFHVQNKSYHFN